MKTGAALAVAVIATGCLTHPAGAAMMGPAPIVVDGFQTPESVLYDARGDVYLVSNINGNPTAADGNGFISKVSPAGRMIARLDRRGHGPRHDFSPSGTDAIYPIDRMDKVTAVAKGPDLNRPNGVAVRADGTVLVVVFADKGEISALGRDGRRVTVATLPAGQLDGIEIAGDGSLLVSSWASSSVYRVTKDGKTTAVVERVTSPADIGYDAKRHRVLIPLFQENRVQIHSLR